MNWRSPRFVTLAAVLALSGVGAACSTQVSAPADETPDTPTARSDASTSSKPARPDKKSPGPKRTSTTAAKTTTTAEATTTTQKPTNTTWPSQRVGIGPAPTGISAVGQSGGEATAVLQQRLLDLGFWHEGVNGSYGLTTGQAVMAFQKYKGLPATGSTDQATADALTSETERAFGRADAGTLVEIDKTRQLLFILNDGKVVWVLNTSTGNGKKYTEPDQNTPGKDIRGVAMTPDGLWQMERQRKKGWWKGDLGEIYRPKYFVGGIAVHGSNSVPNYPASHGCVRVTTTAMDFIWANDLIPLRMPVWVHGG
ncbi:MAG: L,D-transpeptidase family protein [Ilumatobacteraceae bacterium]